MWRRRERSAELLDVVELLQGIGATLMVISAKLDELIALVGGDEDDEAEP